MDEQIDNPNNEHKRGEAGRALVSGGSAASEQARREAARLMGSASTPAKQASSRENGKRGARTPEDFTPEVRAKMSASQRIAWERRRAEGKVRTGPAPKPLPEFPCTCGGGDGPDHTSRCPRGRAMRRREKSDMAASQ